MAAAGGGNYGPDWLAKYWRDFDSDGRLRTVNAGHSRYALYLSHTLDPGNLQVRRMVDERQAEVKAVVDAVHNGIAAEGRHPFGDPRTTHDNDPAPRDRPAHLHGSGAMHQRSKPRNYEHGAGVNNEEWGTSGPQLNTWCTRHKVKAWRGVWSWDEAPTPYRPADFCVILNLAPTDSKSGGTHWVACRVRGAVAEYFDSYGQRPDSSIEARLMGHPGDPPSNIRGWLDSMGVTTVHYNKMDLQGLTTDVCGEYACWFALHGQPKNNPKAWGWVSPVNPAHNDRMIKRLVRIRF